jgi:hypothetical protein
LGELNIVEREIFDEFEAFGRCAQEHYSFSKYGSIIKIKLTFNEAIVNK